MSSVMRNIVQQEIFKRSETKMLTTQGTSVMSTSVSSYAFPLVYPAQADGAAGRDGNRISPVGLKVSTVYDQSAGESLWIRQIILVVKDGKGQDDASVMNSLFESTAGGTTADITPTGTVQDVIRRCNRERFKVLRDDIVKLDPDNHNSCDWLKRYIKFPRYAQDKFSADADTQPSQNRIVMIVLPMHTDGAGTENVDISYRMDYYYKDL